MIFLAALKWLRGLRRIGRFEFMLVPSWGWKTKRARENWWVRSTYHVGPLLVIEWATAQGFEVVGGSREEAHV